MDKETLIKELNRLAEDNEQTNPIAASILYTLSGLCVTDAEELLAIETEKINNFFIKHLRKLINDES